MFHKVVWQHMQAVVGPIITTLPQTNLFENLSVREFRKSVKIWQIWPWVWCVVFCPPCRLTGQPRPECGYWWKARRLVCVCGDGLRLTMMTLKKSSSVSVSRIFSTVALAISILSPFMLPLTSSRMTTSLGHAAALMYLHRATAVQNYTSLRRSSSDQGNDAGRSPSSGDGSYPSIAQAAANGRYQSIAGR